MSSNRGSTVYRCPVRELEFELWSMKSCTGTSLIWRARSKPTYTDGKSVFFDRYGFMRLPARPVTMPRLGGIAFLLIGVALIQLT
jgi:hypothetical protein